MKPQLKAGTQTSDYKSLLMLKQSGLDAITGIEMTVPCLDHDHKTGHCRGLLQRETNAFEGKVWNAWTRFMKHQGVDFIDSLRGLAEYHSQDYSNRPLHSTHRTTEEKRITKNKRAKKARISKKNLAK